MRQTRDPLLGFEERCVHSGLLTAEDLRTIDGEAMRLIEEAVVYAEESPPPKPEDLFSDVYVRY